MLQGALDCKGKDPTISQTTAQQSDDPLWANIWRWWEGRTRF